MDKVSGMLQAFLVEMCFIEAIAFFCFAKITMGHSNCGANTVALIPTKMTLETLGCLESVRASLYTRSYPSVRRSDDYTDN